MNEKIEKIIKESITSDLVDKYSVDELKNKGENRGYSVYLYSNVLMRIFTNYNDWYRIEFLYNVDLMDKFPKDVIVKKKTMSLEKKEVPLYQIDTPKNMNSLVETIEKLRDVIHEQGEYIFNTHNPSFTYGCCGLYEQCSDAKKCLQANIDREYAKGCSYRSNLENNRIFYGKNKNI